MFQQLSNTTFFTGPLLVFFLLINVESSHGPGYLKSIQKDNIDSNSKAIFKKETTVKRLQALLLKRDIVVHNAIEYAYYLYNFQAL